MSNGSAILSIILGVLTLISVVASAVAVARASLAKSTIETLQSSNAALTERVDILEEERDRQEKKIAEMDAENTVLRRMKSGAEGIERLTQAIAKNTTDWHTQHTEMIRQQNQMSTSIVAVHDLMTELLRRTA